MTFWLPGLDISYFNDISLRLSLVYLLYYHPWQRQHTHLVSIPSSLILYFIWPQTTRIFLWCPCFSPQSYWIYYYSNCDNNNDTCHTRIRQRWLDVGPAAQTLAQHLTSAGPTSGMRAKCLWLDPWWVAWRLTHKSLTQGHQEAQLSISVSSTRLMKQPHHNVVEALCYVSWSTLLCIILFSIAAY